MGLRLVLGRVPLTVQPPWAGIRGLLVRLIILKSTFDPKPK